MARWKYTLDLEDVWGKAKLGDISYKELAEEVAKRIKLLPCYSTDSKLRDICTEFEYFDDEGDAEYEEVASSNPDNLPDLPDPILR